MFSDLGTEIAILNLRTGTYFGLNPVGAFIWKLIQEKRLIADICREVVGMYDVSLDRCEADVQDLLRNLLTQELIIVEAEQ